MFKIILLRKGSEIPLVLWLKMYIIEGKTMSKFFQQIYA